MDPTPAPLSDYETRRLESGDFSDAIYTYKSRTASTLAVARRVVYEKFQVLNGRPLSTKKFVGYHEDSELPVKKGMIVTIKKGTLVTTIGHGSKPAGKTYKIQIDHILNGSFRYRGHRNEAIETTNPKVRWPGPGGYWSDADINDIPEAVS